MNSNITQLRRTTFSHWFGADEALTKLVGGEPSHHFLTTIPVQNCCQYLTEFVVKAGENLLNTRKEQLKILDWGCGKGYISYYLKEAGAQVYSCDIDSGKDDSTFYQKIPVITNYNISVDKLNHSYQLPYASETFDIVVSFGVLEHVEHDQLSINEIYRILKPNGLFFCFYLPYQLSWVQHALHLVGNWYHDRLYSKKKVQSLLSTNFRLIDHWYRQLYPKSRVIIFDNKTYETIDLFLTEHTPLKYLSTYIEFLAQKNVQENQSLQSDVSHPG